MVRTSRSISEYDALFDPIPKVREEKNANQSGDPAKAAQVLLKVIAAENPPVHLLLGKDAVRLVREKLDTLMSEIRAWETVSCSTDFA